MTEGQVCRYCGTVGPFQDSLAVLYFTAPLAFLLGRPICKTCYWARIRRAWVVEFLVIVVLSVIWFRY